MLIQLVALLATVLGLWSTWLVGKRHRSGWTLGIACCLLWCAVNLELQVWAGVASAGIAAALSARNWQHWRTNRTP